MKISVKNLIGTIKETIEELCSESDTIASGVIGPSFSTSGPGSGWSRQHDACDYAERALSDEYGVLYYIDSADGRRAELDSDGEMEWSDESVVEIILPTIEEALEDPVATASLLADAANYGADEDEIESLKGKIAQPYEISDGMVTEYASTLEEAAQIAEDWYGFLADDGKVEELPDADLEPKGLAELQASIDAWQERIAESMGAESWAGHGNYYVSAADRAGLNLAVRVRE